MKAVSETAAVRSGGGTLVGMGVCYALGAFTDNFYKQAAILLAAGVMTDIQGIATILFSLPFVLFSAWAGALADRTAKKNIVVGAKALELFALAVGGLMLYAVNWNGMLAVIFLMGMQSAFFSPAINGSIPEHFEARDVPRANSLIKLASTVAILAGMAAAGIVLDFRPEGLGGLLPDIGVYGDAYGRAAAFAVLGTASVVGLGAAFVLRKRPASLSRGEKSAFPWAGPAHSVKHAWECRNDKRLALALMADAWFYGVAAVVVVSIANLSESFGYGKSAAGFLTALLMLGVAAGALVAGRFQASSWRFLLAPSARGMSFMLLLVAASPFIPESGVPSARFVWFGSCLFLAGAWGGLYLIPLESFIQVRPAPDQKGKVIAVSNFLSFVAMALFGAAFLALRFLPPAVVFLAYGAIGLCFSLFAAGRIRRLAPENLGEGAASFTGFLLRVVLAARYSVTEQGLEASPPIKPQNGSVKPGVLILPNHPALIDPVIVYSRLAGLRPRPLADEAQLRGFFPRLAARFVRAATIPDLSRVGSGGIEAVRQGLETIVAALKAGDNVLLYPAGRLCRSGKEVLGAKAAAAHILEAVPEARVLLVRTKGLWGSGFGYASGAGPRLMPLLARGAFAVVANMFFFTPKRNVHIEYAEPADLPRDGDKNRLNRFLEAYYAGAETPPVTVPRFFWQKIGKLSNAAEKTVSSARGSSHNGDAPSGLSPELLDAARAIVREKAGLPEDAPLPPERELVADLHMDSLAVMETVLELEALFGNPITSPEALVTVGDCFAAAAGVLESSPAEAEEAAPAAWLQGNEGPDAAAPLGVAPGAENIVDAFFRLAKQDPDRVLTAERSGLRTRRETLVGVLALSQRFAALPDERIGIMLPAVPAALAVWLGLMLAGKEPVFINWTVGRLNVEHCLKSAGARRVVSASALLDQLERTGSVAGDLPVDWIAVDKLGASLRMSEKIRAAFLAFLHCSPLPFRLRARRVAKTAAVLFTSGSESRPKGVPLTHENILCNVKDVLGALGLAKKDALLAMLPPFHSFGLLAGLAAPSVAGLRAVLHANPTESAVLAGLVRDYKATVMGTTPTFLDGLLAKARGGAALASLRSVFAGAEKCPEATYRAFAEVCPQAALCEGYGITECSPVVAVNRPDSVVAGSIGRALPSVETAVVLEEDGVAQKRAAPGQTGMLLVRGPSVFSGYLAPVDGGEAPADPFVAFEGASWYRTGDLVAADETGRLFFKGRLKRFVKIGGEMISLPQMEEALQQAFASRPDLPEDGKPYVAVSACGGDEAGQAEIAAYTTFPATAQTVNQALRDAGLGRLYAVRRVVKLEEIPLLGSGKIDYRALETAPRADQL